MWFKTMDARCAPREVRLVRNGNVYAYSKSSGIWPYVYPLRKFLRDAYRFDWYWECDGKFHRASQSTVKKYRRVIESGEYESLNFGMTQQQINKEHEEWLRGIKERRSLREAKRTLSSIRKALRPQSSRTTASPPEPTSAE